MQRVSAALEPVEVGEEGAVIIDIDENMSEDDVMEKIFENCEIRKHQ